MLVEKEIISPGRRASCHTDRKHFAKGLCQRCYYNTPEWREKARAYNNRPEVRAKRNARQREKNTDGGGHLWDRYKITLEEYDRLLHDQNGQCAICGSEDPKREGDKRLLVDHDHSTGEVRGLLCHDCNMGIGRFNDDPELLMAAIRYLQQKQTERTSVD